MLLKALLVIGVIAAIYFFFFKKSTPLTKERYDKKRKDDEETMVECESCSTYISTAEAIVVSGKFYCSTECRDKA
ncbi:MAG: PP0621 family protein [Helicobacteraceae bacterium]|jgi:uncharacterized protein|nr:PP0621 family protein [Helicobacteraceae bacterium]